MVSYCDEIVLQIMAASTDADVKDVVTESFTRLQLKSNRSTANYLTYMIVTLQATKADGLAPETATRIDVAIDLFRDYRKKKLEYFF